MLPAQCSIISILIHVMCVAMDALDLIIYGFHGRTHRSSLTDDFDKAEFLVTGTSQWSCFGKI